MYTTVLTAHSFLRWVIVAAGVWAIVSVLPSRVRDGRPASVLPGLIFSIMIDVQVLLGLLLYLALSPITTTAMQDLGAAMKIGSWRFWAVEHPVMMMAALVCVHVGRGRRGTPTTRRALIAYAIALVAILVATPWPFMPQGRPWVRW
jgi:hypothetical protein